MVAMPVPEPWLSRLSAVQAEVRPAHWRITMAPHITLLPPSRPILSQGAAAEAFRALEPLQPPLTVRSGHVYKFTRNSRHTLVLLVQPAHRLRSLATQLTNSASWQETTSPPRHSFEPHITLANQLSDAEVEASEAELRALNPYAEFLGDIVVLYQKEASWPKWIPIAEKQLKH